MQQIHRHILNTNAHYVVSLKDHLYKYCYHFPIKHIEICFYSPKSLSKF